MSTNKINCKSIIPTDSLISIERYCSKLLNYNSFSKYLSKNFQIDITMDQDIINGYKRDWSNLEGDAQFLSRPKNDIECAIVLKCCQLARIPVTISSGRTNLTGSATPNGGLILSMEKIISPSIKIDIDAKTVTTPVGVYLEEMRKEVLKQSNNSLYYPVDPTSREDAMIGGTLSCNASGFIPGPAGATRYWTEELTFLTIDGMQIFCKRGEYVSENGQFIFDYPFAQIKLQVPDYPRPNIKNASGPFSNENGKIDLIDLLVGSEGIFGLITSSTFRLKDMPNEFLDLFFTLPSENNAIKFHQYISNYLQNDLSKITALEYFGYNCQNFMKHKNKLFKSSSDVGIYMQIPIYNKKIDDIIESWFEVLMTSNCNINENNIFVLNDKNNWKTFFEARHSIPANALEKSRKLKTYSILTDTIVPPKKFKLFLKETHLILQSANIEYLLFGHLGDCHLHFHFIPTIEQQPAALEAYKKIIKKSSELGGVYSAEHGTGKRKRSDFLHCFGDNAVKQIKKTKSAIDPYFLLNQGNIIDFDQNNTYSK